MVAIVASVAILSYSWIEKKFQGNISAIAGLIFIVLLVLTFGIPGSFYGDSRNNFNDKLFSNLSKYF